jgi:hypothetical protein
MHFFTVICVLYALPTETYNTYLLHYCPMKSKSFSSWNFSFRISPLSGEIFFSGVCGTYSPHLTRFIVGILNRLIHKVIRIIVFVCRSQWPRGLSHMSSAARLLRLWVQNPPGTWMFVCCEYCVLSSRGLCDGLITGPEESYRLWRVVVCDQETSKTRRLKARYWAVKIQPQWFVTPRKQQQQQQT